MDVRSRMAEERRLLFVERLRLFLWIVVAATLCFAIGDLALWRNRLAPLYGLKALLLASAAVALYVLRRAPDWTTPVRIALLIIGGAEGVIASSGYVGNEVLTTPFLSIAVCLITALMLPWGVGQQLTVAGIAAAAVLGNALVLRGNLGGYLTVAALSASFASLYVVQRMEQLRRAASEHQTRREEDGLRESEERFRQLAENIRDIIWMSDPHFRRVFYVNPAFQVVTGHPCQALYDRPELALELIHPDDRGAAADALARDRAGETTTDFSGWDYRVVRRDGAFRWMWTRIFPVYNAQNEVYRLVGISQDITERKRIDEERSALLEMARDLSGTFDLAEILRRVQRRTAELLPCDHVLTFYWDPAKRLLRMIGQYGVASDRQAELEALRFRPGDPFPNRLISAGSAVINEIEEQDLLPVELLRSFGITAMVGTPLVVRGRTLGAFLAFNSIRPRRFEPGQVQLFEAIARHVAVAMESADLYRAQKAEAEIAAALARVGQEMISSLDTPVLLERLCRLTTEVLACDSAHTFLHEAGSDTYVPVCAYGLPAEEWEATRILRIPGSAIAGLLSRLKSQEVVEVVPAQLRGADPIARLVQQFGLTRGLFVTLRRGNDIIGLHAASYRGERGTSTPFAPHQVRVARGIAQVASLAMQNARLVEQLDEANTIKAHFVATLSHELRNPLNTIIGYGDMLLDEASRKLTAEEIESVQRMRASAIESLDVVTATLDLSRFEARRVPLDLQDVRIEDLFREMSREWRLPREKTDLRMEWRVASDLPALRTDPVKLKMVLKNLVGNAVKFTERGAVVLDARARDRGVEFSVSDTGIGIDPRLQGTLFEPFTQAHGAVSRGKGGAGLGLYITHRLVEILNGRVTAESAVNCGSTFRVWIPHVP